MRGKEVKKNGFMVDKLSDLYYSELLYKISMEVLRYKWAN